jgi:hypothetical protein
MSKQIENRLMDHILYGQTCNANESVENPNKAGAENFLLGTQAELELKSNLIFYPHDIKEQLDEAGEPCYYPFTETREFLVAFIKEDSTLWNMTARVNVYAVYTIKGIKEILTQNGKKNIRWQTVQFPSKLYKELITKINASVNKNELKYSTPIPIPDSDKSFINVPLNKDAENANKITWEDLWQCSVS